MSDYLRPTLTQEQIEEAIEYADMLIIKCHAILLKHYGYVDSTATVLEDVPALPAPQERVE